MADLFGLVFSAVRAGQPIGHGTDGYYIGENGEHMLYAVSRAIGEALVALGKASTDKVTTFSPEELDKYFGGVSAVSFSCSMGQIALMCLAVAIVGLSGNECALSRGAFARNRVEAGEDDATHARECEARDRSYPAAAGGAQGITRRRMIVPDCTHACAHLY